MRNKWNEFTKQLQKKKNKNNNELKRQSGSLAVFLFRLKDEKKMNLFGITKPVRQWLSTIFRIRKNKTTIAKIPIAHISIIVHYGYVVAF